MPIPLFLLHPPPPFPSLPHSHHFLSLPFPSSLSLRRNPNFTANSSSSSSSPSPIQRIAEKLLSLGFLDPTLTPNPNPDSSPVAGEIFLPNSKDLPFDRVGHTIDPSWAGKSAGDEERDERVGVGVGDKEMRRLRRIGISVRKGILKIGKAGITEGVVNGIHERWRNNEVVKVVVEDVWGLNMKRTHDLLEKKTGGMVVWRSGSKVVLYRGVDYKYPYFSLDEASTAGTSASSTTEDELLEYTKESQPSVTTISSDSSLTRKLAQSSLVHGVGHPNRVRPLMPGEQQFVEEADRLLVGLGPRFMDWWGSDPLPVDADLLPAVIPGYRKPFRLLPYGVKLGLTNDEMNVLKRLGRPLPCHFAVGRTSDLHGLAAAIVKLWEKSELAKVAVKRGINSTDNKLIAEELKRLTGGLMLSRDQDFIVLYRGKDFLPLAVSVAIEERRKRMKEYEQWINDGSLMSTTMDSTSEAAEQDCVGNSRRDEEVEKNIDLEQKITNFIEAAGKRTSTKELYVGPQEKAQTAKLHAGSEQAAIPQEMEEDKKGITEEERYMLKKVGLKMKPYLLLGKRGAFDGTIQNMHLHWKYRELVKIICGGRSIAEAQRVAEILAAESGGMLVAVERVSKGFAIIVYRGRNYRRPVSLRPETLPNKREAMRRSIEAQRYASLKLHVLEPHTKQEELQFTSVEVDGDVEAIPMSQNNDVDYDEGNQKVTQQEKQITVSSPLEADSKEAALNSSPGNLHMETQPDTGFDSQEDVGLGYNDEHDNLEHGFRHETMEMVGESAKRKSIPVPSVAVNNENNEPRPRTIPLTNKERLLLRKAALNMKRRPLFSVDGNNFITGVAKAIREHFKKSPFAIVNVKGRAKGSSVHEVALKLEQATGAVLVSQEPSKVILYRGWGARLGTDFSFSTTDYVHEGKGLPLHPVSPELIAAMKLECGLMTA